MKNLQIDLRQTDLRTLTIFPDGQMGLTLDTLKVNNVTAPNGVHVVCTPKTPSDLMEVLLLSDSLDKAGVRKNTLTITYLPGARSDSEFKPGDAVAIEVVAKLINLCKFEKVELFDPHSSVAPALINKRQIISNKKLVEAYRLENAVLISPDAGSAKRVPHYLEWNPNLTDTVDCVKVRDPQQKSKIVRIDVLDAARCHERNCIIIDDLCDGGATFVGIAQSLKRQRVRPLHLTLMVTHGVFSKGFRELETNFQQIFTTDSYARAYDSTIVTVVPQFEG